MSFFLLKDLEGFAREEQACSWNGLIHYFIKLTGT